MSAVQQRGALSILASVLFVWVGGYAAAQDGQSAVVETIGKDGGALCVANQEGDTIELTIPAGALTEDVEISLCPLSTPASDAIAAHVFPGVEILPDGLSLLVPARLKLMPAVPVADPCMVVLYHVRSAEFVVPLDSGPASEDDEDGENSQDEIAGYLSHFSTYGGGEPTRSEAEALAELAFEMIPAYDPYGYQAFEEALHIAVQTKKMIALLGGEDPYPNNVEEAVLSHIKDFLAEARPEPPCDPDYIQATVVYFRAMSLLGLPVYDDLEKSNEVAAIRSQMEDLFQEVANRCLRQLNLTINIDVIWGENLEKNYNGVINLGWQVYGDDPSYVYGTGELPVTGGGQYGDTTTTLDGVWYVVAEGSVVLAEDEAGMMTDLVLELALRGEVLEEVVSCNPFACVSSMSSYHYETALRLSLKGTSTTVVTIEPFDEGVAITTTTLEKVVAPLEQ